MKRFTSFFLRIIRNFKLTALQLSAFIILPLFVFALASKIKEKKEFENSANEIIVKQDSQQQNYNIKTVSQPVIYRSKELEDSNYPK